MWSLLKSLLTCINDDIPLYEVGLYTIALFIIIFLHLLFLYYQEVLLFFKVLIITSNGRVS